MDTTARTDRVAWLRCALVTVLALGGATASAQDDPPANPSMQEGRGRAMAVENPDSTHRLVVIVRTRNNNGKVYCALWRGPEGYPRDRTRAVGEARDTTLQDNQAVCIFNGVDPGEHAVAVFHDENGNNDLDANLLGIPSEGTGASNGEHNTFGPPRYPNARFMIPDVETHRITIPIYY